MPWASGSELKALHRFRFSAHHKKSRAAPISFMYWSVFLQTDKTHHLLLLIQWSLASFSDFSGQEKNLWTEFKLENAVEKKNKFFNPTIFIDFLTPSTKMSHLQLKCRSLPGYFHTTPCCPWINLCSALKLILSQFWVRVQIKELTHSHTFPFQTWFSYDFHHP